ncbi:energy-coupling factor transport system ATP-binding protein [Paenibacillus sp. UNCCL117]|uniref:ATP-binding cassette domain-containing protein n=1 Tax=unclassified Paenibacillus TaxID=185978 RepID=UPI000883B27D|nr:MULTISPECIES: ATP-binding cassette domain-containing protein [unclassified Paenibacillus]SDC66523.1 energy-coupling factor transport system ATP-binding protein [Paenibacillus sp. cl123]SFW23062.1 energy-coupling factor transport system ATP-binding protein [Paenibacillus sp. UNCCL117]
MTLSLIQASAAAPDHPERLLLNPLDLSLSGGTITLLIGRTGSGKSTLLQLLAGVRAPASGEVRLDGAPLWRKGRPDRRLLLRLGLVFQFPEQQLFARTIRHEFAYSLRPFRLSRMEEEERTRAASAVLGHTDAFAPERSPFTLSGGQRRRLALATTAAAGPAWMLMDEPTAGLEAAAVLGLLDYIRERRENGGGTVIVTHDLDTFLPLADRVVILQDGNVAADLTPRALCAQPELLLRTGVGVPGCVTVSKALGAQGITIPPDRLTPEETAEAIASALAFRGHGEGARDAGWAAAERFAPYPADSEAQPSPFGAPGEAGSPPGSAGFAPEDAGAAPSDTGSALGDAGAATRHAGSFPGEAESTSSATEKLPLAANGEPAPPRTAFLRRADPRAKWLLYVLSVIGTMLQESWLGLTISLLPVVFGFIGLPRSAFSSLRKVMKPLAVFFLLSVALSGLTLTTDGDRPLFGFSAEQAATTAFYVYRLLVITLASLWFAVATPYGGMVQGLNWALSYFHKAGLPVDSFALAVSLIFRFIPMIMSEWERFSLIVRARGKAALRPGTVRVRDIPALVVPLMMSLFQRAEDLTTAMEMKGLGLGRSTLHSVQPSLLAWSWTDTLLSVAGMLWLAVLLATR